MGNDKKKKFKKEKNGKLKGPRHGVSDNIKNGKNLIAHAEFYDFSPMPCVCCNCCNSEYVQERSFFRAWDNRLEINRPCSPLCCMTGEWTKSCVYDSISVYYYDRSPIRNSNYLCNRCGPPVIFLYRPKFLCIDCTSCFGESIMYAPTSCFGIKQCCIFGTPCYSNRLCCPATCVLASGVLNGNYFLSEWRLAAQRYRRMHTLDEKRMSDFKVIDGFLGAVTNPGEGKNKIDLEVQQKHDENRAERAAEEQRTGKKIRQKRCCLCLPMPPPWVFCKKKSVEEKMYDVYMDYEGKLVTAMDLLDVDDEERDLWVRMWMEIDEDMNNEMSYNEFTDYFQLTPDEWVRRTFTMINQAGNGVATLAEFVTFCRTYVVVDKDATQEFAFRLMSSRNSTQYNAQWSILGIEDVRGFVGERYNPKTVSHRNKMAFGIFKMMDRDGDGGLDIQEWHEFCENNDAFARFAHTLLHHLRKCIFGQKFWVERSRVLKQKNGGRGGLSKINKLSEEYTNRLLDDEEEPVVDRSGRPKNNKATPFGEDREDPLVRAARPTITFLGELDMKYVSERPFEEDMEEVHALMEEERIAKKAAKEALLNSAAALSNEQHDKMRSAILDLLHTRRPKRWAWALWCDAVGLEARPGGDGGSGEASDPGPETQEASAEEQLEAHRQALNDVHVKIISVTEKRKQDANDTAVEDYLDRMKVGVIMDAARCGADRTQIARSLYGPDGPVIMTDIYRKQGLASGAGGAVSRRGDRSRGGTADSDPKTTL